MTRTRKISIKQKKFADHYNETGNGTEAALMAYDTEDRVTAGSIACENLKKPQVRAYLESKANDAAVQIYELSQKASKEEVRLKASQDILNRGGYTPIEKRVNLNLRADLSDRPSRELIKIKEEYENKLRLLYK